MPPWIAPLTDWTGIAALITALGVLVSSVRAATRRADERGGDTAASLERIETAVKAQGTKLDDLDDRVRDLDARFGHEIGELRADALHIHEDHAARLRRLEGHQR
ncbi:hypothetical protein FAM15407_001500 [Propionibacterium freudenreichii]|uniref:hypothetical protein n=1 Tax=Propionibacterium freudenreichii TaxID=1744 RepID=UPI002434252B|nr:hypothetical protein [Propionibacterium freudenreichii]MDK9657922.1 hypothetical protein [Propionibacterium freudenreichii]WFF31075.1 hypothetical protein FAM19024_000263 [Propionibacterium freudenreichii]